MPARPGNRLVLAVLLAVLLFTTPVITGCNPAEPEGEGFAIYLTAQDLSIAEFRQTPLDEVRLADEPLIALDDIVSYSWDTHEIELAPEAFTRFEEVSVPTTGRFFIVCVDTEPIYRGAFWAVYSSLFPPDDIVLCENPASSSQLSVIQLRAPYSGDDPRSNSEIRESLDLAGKLK